MGIVPGHPVFWWRLKMFYEKCRRTKSIHGGSSWQVTASWLWGDRIIWQGILVTAICIFGKRIRLQRTVSGMEKLCLKMSVSRLQT